MKNNIETKEEIKTLGLKVSISQWRWLRKYAFDRETSVNATVKNWINEKMQECANEGSK